MSPQFYIFLDVDGVLHPARWGVPGITVEQMRSMSPGQYELEAALRGFRAMAEGPPLSHLSQFEEAIQPHLDKLQIVISSSWRHDVVTYNALLEAMSPPVRARVLGGTPKDRSRPLAINQWLHEHAGPDFAAIVVDDDESH